MDLVAVNDKDLEATKDFYVSAEVKKLPLVSIDEVAETHRIRNDINFLRKMREAEEWLDRKMGVEIQGIDRVLEDDKRPPSILNIFFFWWSMNVHVGIIAIGLLGPQFGLSLKASVASSIIGNVLGAACTGFTGTLGPKTGLRQIATSRYSFGFWGAKICSILNVIIGGGFCVVNYVVAGEILSAVSDFTLSVTVGIVIIAVISYLVSLFGFRVIHSFEKYSWISSFILMCVLIGQAAPHIDAPSPGTATGIEYYGAFLSFLAINFANACGWCTIAADYYVNYPASTSPLKIWALTFFGIIIPTVWTITVGACLANAVNAYQPYHHAYYHNNHGLGGLLREVYQPLAFSKFCLIALTFSILGNNIANNYSSGLCMQLLGHYFHAVPRFIWSLLFATVVAILAIVGQQSLSTIINNFVSLLGYWAVSFASILLIEDKWFRRHEGYNLSIWDKSNGLPLGIAAVFALLCGFLIGGLLGMAQLWWVGPIALKFGPYGGDVGIYLSCAITLLVYPIARTLEKKRMGR